MMMDYGDVVACAPVTVPYVRRSEKGAAWWLGSALRRLLEVSGLTKQQADGLCLSSFTLAPDGPAPFVQYIGLSPRFLEFLPTGGACGVMALRRAARAVQCGDAEVVACVAGDTNGSTSFHDLLAQFSSVSRYCVWPYGAGGPNQSFALLTQHAMHRTGATREELIDRFERFAGYHTRHMLRDEEELRALFAGYDLEFSKTVTPGECVNPTSSFQIVASPSRGG